MEETTPGVQSTEQGMARAAFLSCVSEHTECEYKVC